MHIRRAGRTAHRVSRAPMPPRFFFTLLPKETIMSIFEALMLLCFGVSWPISIAKSVRTKVVAGKSPLFMAILCIGYMSGIVHKALYSLDWIIALYALNLILVATDLALYYRYLPGNTVARKEKNW
jgi:hypothetical protein